MKASELMKAIRAKCLDCCCGQAREVRLCVSGKCSLHPYRTGAAAKRAEAALPEESAAGSVDDGGAAEAPGGVFLRQAEKLRRDCTRAKGRLKAGGASKSPAPAADGGAC